MSGLKNILFYPEYKKTLFFDLIRQKMPIKNIRFFDKNHALTPLENFDYIDFFKTSLFWSKKHSFLPRASKNKLFLLNFSKKYPSQKIRIFGKKNIDFSDVFIISLFRSKKHYFFLSRISNKNLFCLILPKKYPWKNIRFFA